jgi:hypothetical protein
LARRARWFRWARWPAASGGPGGSGGLGRRTRQVVEPRGTKKGKTMGAKAFPKKWRRRGWQTFGCSPAAWGVFRRTLTAGKGLRVGRRFPAHSDAARFPGKHQNQNSLKCHNSVLILMNFEAFCSQWCPPHRPPGHFRMHSPRQRKKHNVCCFFPSAQRFSIPRWLGEAIPKGPNFMLKCPSKLRDATCGRGHALPGTGAGRCRGRS